MSGQKVLSNLAKYKNGQLTCIVCNVPVKNEIYWTGHVNGRLHRDNINLLKRKAEPDKPSSSQASQHLPSKRSRVLVDTEVSVTNSSSNIHKNINAPVSILQNKQEEDRHIFKVPKDPGAGPVVSPSASTSTSTAIKKQLNRHASSSSSLSSGADATESKGRIGVDVRASRLQFERLEKEFSNGDDMDIDAVTATYTNNTENDSDGNELGVANSANSNGGTSTSGSQVKPDPKSNLPEGFFDDPKEDAKARGIEFQDPKEVEWELFMKEIASEELQSDSILVVDEEESRKERELDEIEDMMGHWQRVIDLEKKKETRTKRMDSDQPERGSSDEEEDFNDELDWRIKKF